MWRAPVAQLDRALPSGGRGQGFESLRARQLSHWFIRNYFIIHALLSFATNDLSKLVLLGLKVEQSVIRDKWGLPDPDPEGKLLGMMESRPDDAAPVSQITPGIEGDGAPATPALNRAVNRAQPQPDPVEPFVEQLGQRANLWASIS